MSNETRALAWFKSSYSGTQGDDCVEIAISEHAIHVRDSKQVTRSGFAVSEQSWGNFVEFASMRQGLAVPTNCME